MTELTTTENILAKNISDIMEKKYLDYGMSVIVDRALPDIRDGLKPVHRRIIFAMHKLANRSNSPHKKSARIVGDVIGKYHPHGDTSVYEAMVRMAQEFSMRATLVDGQGNFGSVDGDSPAAMRYTESRMSVFAENMLADIDKDTVDYHDNYDGTEQIPIVLPTTYPNLLINGGTGIAVGMATNMPTHNPIEVLNCLLLAIEKGGKVEEEDLSEYMEIMPAPDFPTGGIVHDLAEMEQVWKFGRGRVQLRAAWHEETTEDDKNSIIITEIPFQVNKTTLLEKISSLVSPDENKHVQVEGVSDIRDESDKDGMRIFIELKKEADPHVVFNGLARGSQLNIAFNYNNTVLINNNPQQVGIMRVFNEFILHRLEVITRRTQYLDNKAKNRHHLLAGLMKALDPNVVEQVIEMIRGSKDNAESRAKLMSFLSVDEVQADGILDLKLQKLAASEMQKLKEEFDKLAEIRKDYAEILSSEEKRFEVMTQETHEAMELFEKTKNKMEKRTFGIRLSETSFDPIVLDLAALVKEEECTVILTAEGFARRIPLEEMEQQNRGTRGKSRMKVRDGDVIVQSISCHSHDTLMGITKSGKAFALHAYEMTDTLRGKYINTVANINNEEEVLMLLPVDMESNEDLVLITKNGLIKKTALSNYSSATRKGGIKAITLNDGDEIVHAALSTVEDQIALVNTANKIIRFNMSEIRQLQRGGKGVLGMRINNGDGDIIGGDVIKQETVPESYVVTVSDKGMVKITGLDQYKVQKRGGMGVLAMKATGKVGGLFKAMIVDDLDGELITTTKKGVTNRISLSKVTVTSRNTRGVKLIALDEKDELADVFYYMGGDVEEEITSEFDMDEDMESNAEDNDSEVEQDIEEE
jgi:DNA gyrase subunit A